MRPPCESLLKAVTLTLLPGNLLSKGTPRRALKALHCQGTQVAAWKHSPSANAWVAQEVFPRSAPYPQPKTHHTDLLIPIYSTRNWTTDHEATVLESISPLLSPMQPNLLGV